MKEIKFRIWDKELPTLLKKKGKMSWRELFFSGVGIDRKKENERNKKQKTKRRKGN